MLRNTLGALRSSLRLAQRFKSQQLRVKQVPTAAGGTGTDASRSNLLVARHQKRRNVWEQELAHEAALAQAAPRDDAAPVYVLSEYAEEWLSLDACLSRHRELVGSAQVLAQPEAPVHLALRLNLRTKKSTKFATPFVDCVVLVPHRPEQLLPKRQVLVITADDAVAEAAFAAGALDAGYLDVITKLETGVHHPESFDYVVAHPDCLPALAKVRKILKERLPFNGADNAQADVLQSLSFHLEGVKLAVLCETGIPEEGTLRLPLGHLSWDAKRLEDNLKAYLAKVQSLRPKRVADSAGYIIKAQIEVPPSKERFTLDLESLSSSEGKKSEEK